jgi:hypothetical protein
VTSTTLSIAIPAATAIGVACLSALAAYLAGKRDRRRTLYSEVTKAAVAWEEMLYRVRRRSPGRERELVDRFHELLDDLTYHKAWVGSESRYIGRSYDTLTRGVKSATASLIIKAWSEPVRPLPGGALPGDEFPEVSPLVDAFLSDVRSHLSPWPWRKLAVVWRNRGKK